MRELTNHKMNGMNEALKITVLDEPGIGNACHRYRIGFITANPDFVSPDDVDDREVDIEFQNGAIGEVGVNGISQEALLAILEDRLAGFQGGKFACQENETALIYIRAAQAILAARTTKRLERGVEGTHNV